MLHLLKQLFFFFSENITKENPCKMENDRILKHCTLLGLCLDEENINGEKKT